ncbi:hypothetical protein PR048_026263 [Dryococelus australis]|uniref:Uncharacterized protein n=1 Tax=Dryococelus australis TaxID=614101 RepID=A0ABQ9GKW1_9NEOP|nr:hypothetical protein PR048_026263 [Dryococelus australis]
MLMSNVDIPDTIDGVPHDVTMSCEPASHSRGDEWFVFRPTNAVQASQAARALWVQCQRSATFHRRARRSSLRVVGLAGPAPTPHDLRPVKAVHDKAEKYTTAIQVDLKQDFQKCSLYREQPIRIQACTLRVTVGDSHDQHEWLRDEQTILLRVVRPFGRVHAGPGGGDIRRGIMTCLTTRALLPFQPVSSTFYRSRPETFASSMACRLESTALCTNKPISTAHWLSAVTVEDDNWTPFSRRNARHRWDGCEGALHCLVERRLHYGMVVTSLIKEPLDASMPLGSVHYHVRDTFRSSPAPVFLSRRKHSPAGDKHVTSDVTIYPHPPPSNKTQTHTRPKRTPATAVPPLRTELAGRQDPKCSRQLKAVHVTLRLREQGTFTADRNDCGAPKRRRTPELEEAVLHHVEQSTPASTRTISHAMGVAPSIV